MSRRRNKISNTVRDQIVLDHLKLVKAIAVRVHENLPVHVDLDDLVHAGVMGLFDAANKYNPDKKVVFHSYAKYRIKGAILDSLRQLDWASRDLRKRQKMVEAMTRELCDKLKRTPTEAEIAQKMEISPRTVEAIKDRLMERFGAKNTAGLVFFAVKNNLID